MRTQGGNHVIYTPNKILQQQRPPAHCCGLLSAIEWTQLWLQTPLVQGSGVPLQQLALDTPQVVINVRQEQRPL